MKEKFFKNKKAIIIIITTILLLSVAGLCSWGIPVLLENTNNDTNVQKEDLDNKIEVVTEDEHNNLYDQENGINDYIKVTYNDFNGKDYKFTLDTEDIASTKVGTQFSTKDYVYTYGYYWTENDAKIVPRDNSLVGWTKQENDIGWGVAVKDRGKTSYEGIYNTIAGEPVTWLNGTFYNCVNMTTMPMLPNNAKHTDYMFFNCSALQSAILPSGMETVGTGMFYKCTALQYVYLPKTINNIAADSFAGYESSLNKEEVLENCKEAIPLKLPTTYTSNAGYKIDITSYKGVLVRQDTSFYYIAATGPNYIVPASNGISDTLSLRVEGTDGNGLEMYRYNKETNKWEEILFYPGGRDGLVPSTQNSNDAFWFTDVIYTSEDLYKNNSNEIYRKADTKNWYDGIYYGYNSDLFGAFKECNSKIKIYCEHEEAPEGFINSLSGKTVFYEISYVKMMEIKHDEFNDK